MTIHPNVSQRAEYDDEGTPYKERWEKVRQQRKQRQEQQRDEQARMHQQQRSAAGTRSESVEALFSKGDQAILDWSGTAADYTRFRVEDHHTDADAVQIVVAALNQMRQERDNAIALIGLLTSEREILRSHIANINPPETSAQRLYRKVGLHESCPEFMIRAARTAFRKQFHPDRKPPHLRADAERQFKAVEAVFAEIFEARKL